MSEPRVVHFEGYDFDATKVVAVDPVASHLTGNLSSDWKYGVKVRLQGAELVFISPQDPRYGYAGCKTTCEDLVKNANILRQRLLDVIWPPTEKVTS